MTFNELTEWYLSLIEVKHLAICNRMKGALQISMPTSGTMPEAM
jgi:hypothetical protein